MSRTSLALIALGLVTPLAGALGQGDTPTPAPPVAPPSEPAPAAPGKPPPDATAPISPKAEPGESARAKDKDKDKDRKDAKKPETPRPPLPRAAVLEDVAGTVSTVDRKAHRIEVETPGGKVALSMDRNTLVYGPHGLVTPFEVKPGAQVRVGRNADFVAYWIAVRGEPPERVSTPDQGTGPGGGAGKPQEPNTGPGAPASPPSTNVGPGSATPGNSTPPMGGPTPGR